MNAKLKIFLTILCLGLGALLFYFVSKPKHRAGFVAKEELNEENVAAIARMEKGHTLKPNFAGQTIPLKSHFNTTLKDSMGAKKTLKNNLEELPTGSQVFCGIPFEIEGVIQLAGRAHKKLGQSFPKKIEGIKVEKTCQQLHVLHGASWCPTDRQKISKIVLNYADNSKYEFDIKAGEHVLDWWGPPANTAWSIGPDKKQVPSGTEMAWSGSNPLIRQFNPDWVVGLYKSTIANPQPNQTISTITYESYETDAIPFLLAITVE